MFKLVSYQINFTLRPELQRKYQKTLLKYKNKKIKEKPKAWVETLDKEEERKST